MSARPSLRRFMFSTTPCVLRCAELNYRKRFQSADLTGQVALITGSRLKIGYQATLMMLRAGARVIATTRFPVDSALRFSKEKDFHQWGDRLHIYGLDLRHTPSVEIFCAHIEQAFDRLDILINNAAQTVRRPPGFYAHLMEVEAKGMDELPEEAQKLMMNHSLCVARLNSFAAPRLEAAVPLPVSWHGKQPGIGLRESAQLSQLPYAYDDTTARRGGVSQGGAGCGSPAGGLENRQQLAPQARGGPDGGDAGNPAGERRGPFCALQQAAFPSCRRRIPGRSIS